ncbi:MAG: glyoxalase/bleomycin resistance protein/dioxygenase [Actinomycetia bacterium]|nr:glyoxalase/bleomycin resistance protein/dioxygenase [Actinomycetes bacterium]
MSVELNHTIVWARDKAASAQFLAGILGLPVGQPTDPFHARAGEINLHDGGRGVYFVDLDGYNMELLTRASTRR